jgi:DNA uptake protein ComE-like DNA-binding protein
VNVNLRSLRISAVLATFILSTPVVVSAQSEPVDINSASAEQLAKVPGMTEGLALMVMGGRPYQSTQELVTRQIVTKEQFEQMKDAITAKAVPKKKP